MRNAAAFTGAVATLHERCRSKLTGTWAAHLRACALAPYVAGHRKRGCLLSLHLLPRNLLPHLPQTPPGVNAQGSWLSIGKTEINPPLPRPALLQHILLSPLQQAGCMERNNKSTMTKLQRRTPNTHA